MNILIVVSHPDSISTLLGLSAACKRKELSYCCFFTGDGVTLLQDNKVLTPTIDAERAVVCEYSWKLYFQHAQPPVESGSQTDLSAMMCSADRVVSL